jgi:iron-sulfur cluster assembly accessory protein
MSTRRFITSITSRSCFVNPATSLTISYRSPISKVAYRYSNYSIRPSKRLLQTQTYSPSIEPPLCRNNDVESVISTNPQREHLTPESLPTAPDLASSSSSSLATPNPTTPAKSAPTHSRFQPRKSAISLTSKAIHQLKNLMNGPDPRYIRVGVKNRGCSGLAYNLEFVDKPGKFDEEVVQDGVRVLIESKALLSIIGSEMDWVEDRLSARFTFKNPNISMF